MILFILTNVSCNVSENLNQYNNNNYRMTQQYLIIVQGSRSHAYIGKRRGYVEMMNAEFSLHTEDCSRYLNTQISPQQSEIQEC